MDIHNRDSNKPSSRRRCLKTFGLTSVAMAALPSRWTTPVVNSVVLPAHAMTTLTDPSCGPLVAEPVNDMIGMVVTATEVQGPITVPLAAGAFSGTESSILGACANGDPQRQEVTFTGIIDSVNSQITGTLDIDIFCGTLLVCEQRTTFTASQTPIVAADDLGAYQGALIGTLSCCEQSASVLSLPINGRSLIRQQPSLTRMKIV